MKYSFFLTFLILIFIFFAKSYSQTMYDFDLLLEVNSNLPEYGFVLEEFNNDDGYRSYLIKIYNADSNLLIQTIDLSEYDFWYGYYDYPYIDSLIDVNFDGYKDLCVVTGIGQNGKNWGYDIFIFNFKDKRFSQNEGFNSIYNISTDDSLKQVYESYWTGCLDCIVWSTYIVQDDKLILIEKDYQDIDMELNKMRRFIEKYKNGKMISKIEVEPIEE
jgi:hypothetical protein